MKILFLCHRLPFPPNRGGRIRAYHILKHLSREHDVTVAAVRRFDDDAAAVAQLRAISSRQILAPVSQLGSWMRAAVTAPTPTPASFAYFHSAQLARSLRRALADSYDLVFVHSAAMASYVARAQAAMLLDFGDMDSQKWDAYGRRQPFPASLVYRAEAWKVSRAEAHWAHRFDLCTCTTRDELATLERLGAARATGWFPNGVDADYFRPSAAACDADAICFLGRMDYYPNADAMFWFCDRVLPELRARRPAITLWIVGANPSRAVRRLADRPGVRVTGTVADVRPYAARAALSVVPLNVARGVQNKILESLAMGLPVVASALAARGTETVPGEHLLTASEPREFVAAILRLLSDAHERRRLSHAGRARVLTHHDWGASMRRLDGMIDACLAGRAGSPGRRSIAGRNS